MYFLGILMFVCSRKAKQQFKHTTGAQADWLLSAMRTPGFLCLSASLTSHVASVLRIMS
jgi:hypothetical protein